MNWLKMLGIWCAIAGMMCGCAAVPSVAPSETAPTAVVDPATASTEEVRAVWVPFMEVRTLLQSGDPTAARGAIAALMQDCADRGINTVYFHVRAHSDAYYASEVFTPHSSAAPLLSKGFDPLSAAVEEGHARGLAVHAWVNPYRIGEDASYARCEDVFEYNGRYYYVPTSEAAQALIVDGVRELVANYAVDGVQFDDYFYPEGAVDSNTPSPFEADVVVQAGKTVADQRRAAVSRLIRAVYDVCHEREGCVFGVSPSYDLERNREQMYADVALWAREAGYVDYLCPQLYVGFQHQYAPFAQELATWNALERDASVSLIAGLALYKTGMTDDPYAGSGAHEWRDGGEIIARQVRVVRRQGWSGAALYSHLSLEADEGREAAVVAAECAALEKEWIG